jgi:hypothetical protein
MEDKKNAHDTIDYGAHLSTVEILERRIKDAEEEAYAYRRKYMNLRRGLSAEALAWFDSIINTKKTTFFVFTREDLKEGIQGEQ